MKKISICERLTYSSMFYVSILDRQFLEDTNQQNKFRKVCQVAIINVGRGEHSSRLPNYNNYIINSEQLSIALSFYVLKLT